MKTNKFRIFLSGLFILTSTVFIYYAHLQKSIVAKYVDGKYSALTFQEKNYYRATSADQFNFDKKLGYIVGDKDSIGLFDHKESVHLVDNLDPSNYIAIRNFAIMEELKMLYVSDEFDLIPISLYENLPVNTNENILYKDVSYYLYRQENPEILKTAEKLAEDARIEIYQFQEVSDEEWLLVKNMHTNTVSAYCREFDYLTGVPTSIYQFEIH